MANRLLFILLVIALCAAPAAGLQTPVPPQEPERQPTFRTEANFVRVDVYPTIKGVPVKDLTLEDFQVLEDGVPQKLSTFEFVQVRTGTPQEHRDEPNTIQQSRDALKNPRARVFILFLDVPHVTIDGSWHIREPLVRMMDRLMGEEDLVGIMTPAMAPSDIAFARKTSVIAGGLRAKWPWGERHTIHEDEIDHLYHACYPWPATRDVVIEMKERRRERLTLNAVDELVRWLRHEREERKAILTISEGWLLFRPNPDLTRPRVISPTGQTEPIPGPEPIGVGPDGRLRVGNPDPWMPGNKSECDEARLHLSLIDNERFFRDIIDEANRANATFYTIDPRGLPVFDYPLGPERPKSLAVDAAHLRERTDNLRVLAANTDGLAVLNNNDLDAGLRRISDDLTSYYLLGYYSSNTKLDGRFRTVKVKVNRPGVEVRARRGYKAASAEEVAAARAAAPPPVPESVTTARAALADLARVRPDARLHAQAIAVRAEGTTVWVAAELVKPSAAAAVATVTVSTAGASGSADVPVAAGQRSFMTSVPLKTAASAPIDVRVRVAATGEIPVTDGVRIDAVTGLSTPLMFRRGPSTGNRYQPAGIPRFSRTERVRFDVPKAGDVTLTGARILGRDGTAIEVPVSVGSRDGWLFAELTLAALAPGDYLVELSGTAAGGEQKVLAAFRIGR